MDNLGLAALGAVCLCVSGLILGIAIVLGIQWYSRPSDRDIYPQPSQRAPVHQHQTGNKTGWLIMTQGPNRGMSILLDQPELRIGRDPMNEIRIDHPQVSRYHAKLTWENTFLYLEDMGSSNGTFVNRTRLIGRQNLKNGDVIGLGMVVMLTFYH